MKKRIFALSLCLIMCLGLIPAAFAASDLDVAEDAIEKNIKSVFVDNDTTEESLTYALQKLIPEGNQTTVTVEFAGKVNATTSKRGSITCNWYLHDPVHNYTTPKRTVILRIPIAEQSASEVNRIEADVAAIKAAFDAYIDAAEITPDSLKTIKNELLTLAEDTVKNGSQVNWSTDPLFSTASPKDGKNGHIRGKLIVTLGAEVRTVELDVTLYAEPAAPSVPTSGTAYPSTQTVELDGKKVEFQMYALKDAAGNPTNYVKVRDLALALNGTAAQFDVGWNGVVDLTAKAPYTATGTENSTPFSGERPYTVPTAPTNVNGAASDLQAIVLTDDSGGQYTYYQLRDLGKKLGFNVGWSAEKGVFIETDQAYSGT